MKRLPIVLIIIGLIIAVLIFGSLSHQPKALAQDYYSTAYPSYSTSYPAWYGYWYGYPAYTPYVWQGYPAQGYPAYATSYPIWYGYPMDTATLEPTPEPTLAPMAEPQIGGTVVATPETFFRKVIKYVVRLFRTVLPQ